MASASPSPQRVVIESLGTLPLLRQVILGRYPPQLFCMRGKTRWIRVGSYAGHRLTIIIFDGLKFIKLGDIVFILDSGEYSLYGMLVCIPKSM